ncbi:MAG TPA: amidase [Candidatus Binataceae bacterium]|nr:amidase [Candidatus Binataceae bacterium]
MAIKPPADDELRELARAHQIDLTPAEVRSLGGAIAAQMRGFERIMAIAPTPQASVARYPKREAGARADRAGDPLNAVVRRCNVAGAASGKLAGKRIGLKDSVCVAGIPASGGSHVLQGYIPDCDATIVTRMLDAGAEIVATLNMDDFALSGDGRTSAYGPTLNPHNPEFCSGGSSSGSAAALYYDWVDITIGTDQGGSIRIPASWCGVAGIKPTYGLVPYTGVMSIDPSLDHVGPMARTVRDVAVMLEVIAGRDPLDHRQLREVAVPTYTATLDRGVKGKRLGLLREGFVQPGAEADVNGAVRAAAAQLEKLGAKIEEVSVPGHLEAGDLLYAIIPEGMMRLMRTGLVGTHHGGHYNSSLAEFFGAHYAERANLEASTVKFMAILGEFAARHFHGHLYARAQNARTQLTAAYDAALSRCDALVMPSTPMKAHRQDEQAPYSMVTNTAPFDLTGHPGLSVPCAMSGGLPVGMMLIGRHFEDAVLLEMAYAFEQSGDWRKR